MEGGKYLHIGQRLHLLLDDCTLLLKHALQSIHLEMHASSAPQAHSDEGSDSNKNTPIHRA